MNKELFDKGLKVRREVLGSEYVDNAIKNADDFSRPLQEFVTEYCWGELWNRMKSSCTFAAPSTMA